MKNNLGSQKTCQGQAETVQRVSMGLTDRRKTAKNLVDSRKN